MRPALRVVRVGALVAVVLGLAGGTDAASSIDAGRAWRDLERIVGLGPRPSGSAALDRTREYIVGELRKVGVRARTQSFVAPTALGPVRMANLIAEIPGRRAEGILFGGHYDTKYYPNLRFVGANDGGSRTAPLLELARSLARAPPQDTAWVALLHGPEGRDAPFN